MSIFYTNANVCPLISHDRLDRPFILKFPLKCFVSPGLVFDGRYASPLPPRDKEKKAVFNLIFTGTNLKLLSCI